MKFYKYVRSPKLWAFGGLIAMGALLAPLIPIKVGMKPSEFKLQRPASESSSNLPLDLFEETEQGPSGQNIEHNETASVENPANRESGEGSTALRQEAGSGNEDGVPGVIESQGTHEENPPQQFASVSSRFDLPHSSGMDPQGGSPDQGSTATDQQALSAGGSSSSSGPAQTLSSTGSDTGSNTGSNTGSKTDGDAPGRDLGAGPSSSPTPSIQGIPFGASNPCCLPGDPGEEEADAQLFPTEDQNTPFGEIPSLSTPLLLSSPEDAPHLGTPDPQNAKSIPEPDVIFLMASGLIGLLFLKRNRHRMACAPKK